MDGAEDALVGEFVVESREGLADVEQQMLAIEAGGKDIDIDLVNAVFRTMHSIKGTAGFLGLQQIGTLAHGLEEVLNRMRNREVVPSSELVTTVLQAADFMKGLIEAVETSNDADISCHVHNLQQFRSGSDQPAEVAMQIEEIPINRVVLSEAAHEFILECHDNLDTMDRDFLALEQHPKSTELLRSVFRTMHTLKGGAGFLGFNALEKLAHAAENILGQLRDGKSTLTNELTSVLLIAVDKCREGLSLVETNGSDKNFDPTEIISQLAATSCVTRDSDSPATESKRIELSSPVINLPTANMATPIVTTPVTSSNKPVQASGTKPAATPAPEIPTEKSVVSTADSTIRVDVALLDKLMTRVGELVLARNQILQRTNVLEDAEFVSTAQRLNLITTELQESVMKTRMQPIGNVWTKFPRVVRDLSFQLGKLVRIEMEGKETELDKTIVEAIKDPLTHLVRNSVDHGIEAPEVRRAAGKPEEGCLLLRAYHEGGQVNIEITDDGAGLNLDRIRQKAVEKGIMNAEQASRLSDREATQLILLPGFSTAQQVTSVSGRGVGMDVVKTNIEKIGGTLDLQSRAGQGTTVKIKIPLTLAIIPALIVTTGGDRYAIPQVSLLELVRLEGDQVKNCIERVHGAPVYRLRGKLLPLVDLAERLNIAETDQSSTEDRVLNIVVLRANDRQYGLIVDKVNDTEEIVVKPLSRQLKGIGEYAGITIMGDGTVALILDVMGLAIASGLAGELRDQALTTAAKDEANSKAQTQTLLVVDLGDSRRFALPTSMVARLEKVDVSSVELAAGREVIQYRDQILPLVRLSDVFGSSSVDGPEPTELQIIVYEEEEGHHCGFVVNRIVDIVETELRLPTQSDDSDARLGTSVIQQRVTDVLNLRNLARHQPQL